MSDMSIRQARDLLESKQPEGTLVKWIWSKVGGHFFVITRPPETPDEGEPLEFRHQLVMVGPRGGTYHQFSFSGIEARTLFRVADENEILWKTP